MAPDPWEFFLLAFGAFRLTRLLGWDDFPPVAALREWLLKEERLSDDDGEPGRPLLAHLVNCPFCLGFWVCLATYISWRVTPGPTLTLAAIFAMSSIVGLIAKNLDE